VEPYYDISLTVKGCKDVYASLDSYVQIETLEKENQYQAEVCFTFPFLLFFLLNGVNFGAGIWIARCEEGLCVPVLPAGADAATEALRIRREARLLRKDQRQMHAALSTAYSIIRDIELLGWLDACVCGA
jgi:hypothetical protein